MPREPYDRPSAFARRKTEIVVGTLSRLRVEKRLERAIACVASLRTRYRVRLVIVGDGPERENLQRLVAKTDAAGFVTLVGHAHHPEKVLPEFDIFLLPALMEQAPISAPGRSGRRRSLCGRSWWHGLGRPDP